MGKRRRLGEETGARATRVKPHLRGTPSVLRRSTHLAAVVGQRADSVLLNQGRRCPPAEQLGAPWRSQTRSVIWPWGAK